MIDWSAVLATVLSSTTIALALGWLVKSLISQFLARDIEGYKARIQADYDRELEGFRAELKRVAFERETRFARLHERRAEIIAELYGYLVKVEAAASNLASTATMPWNEPKPGYIEPSLEELKQDLETFQDYFARNRIFFSEELCNTVENFQTPVQLAHAFGGSVELNLMRTGKADAADEARKFLSTMRSEIMPIKQNIEREFRGQLGVSTDTDDVPQE